MALARSVGTTNAQTSLNEEDWNRCMLSMFRLSEIMRPKDDEHMCKFNDDCRTDRCALNVWN